MLNIDYSNRQKFLLSMGLNLMFLGMLLFLANGVFVAQRIDSFSQAIISNNSEVRDLYDKTYPSILLSSNMALWFSVALVIVGVIFVILALLLKRQKKTVKDKKDPLVRSVATKKDLLTLREYLNKHNINLAALGLFLLATFQLASSNKPLPLDNLLSFLLAGISFFILADLVYKLEKEPTTSLWIFKFFIEFFVILFACWVLINLILPLKGPMQWAIIILGLFAILWGPLKGFLPEE